MNNIIIILVILLLYNYFINYIKIANLGFDITDVRVISNEMILGDKPYHFLDFFKNLLFDSLILYLVTEKFNIDLASTLFKIKN